MDNTKWNEKYSSDDYYYGKNPNDFLVQCSSLLAKKSKVLCLCEGEGRNSVYLASLGHDVLGIDYSDVGKSKAMSLASQQDVHISYEITTLENFKFKENHYDAVISIFCHIEKSSRKKILSDIYHSLKVGGIFIFEAYSLDQLLYNTGGPKDVNLLYDVENLKDSTSFVKWQKCEKIIREVNEGKGHHGLSSVIQGYFIK